MSLINGHSSNAYNMHRAFSSSGENVNNMTKNNSSSLHHSKMASINPNLENHSGASTNGNGGSNNVPNGNHSSGGTSSSTGTAIGSAVAVTTAAPPPSSSSGPGGKNVNNSHSPLHIATMLNTLALNSNPSSKQQSTVQGPYLIRLQNIPKDVTLREGHALFALAHGILSIELSAFQQQSNHESANYIIAKFNSLHLACQYASILDEKSQIFGPSFPFKTYVEVIDELTQQQIPFYGHSQLHQGSPPSPSQVLPYQQQPLLSASGVVSPPQSASSVKRPSLLVQRSRFSFTDPFSNDQGNQSSQQPDIIATPLKGHQDTGKSFLLMESDEINDSIWGNGTGIPSSISGLTTSQPPTPHLEWGTTGRRQSSSFYPSQSNTEIPPMHLTGQVQSSTQLATGLQQPPQPGPPQHQPLSYSLLTPLSSEINIPPQTAQGVLSRQHIPTQNQQQQQQQQHHQPTQQAQSQQQQQKQAQSQQVPQASQQSTQQQSSQTPQHVTPSSSQQPSSQLKINTRSSMPKALQSNNNGPKNAAAALQNTNVISQVDLSLLAKVPPPANPADQNPPCNTLYVGNLPPDATEQELRQLFSSQKGFRRLSFRNKNNNGNGHGPMCFVEFEDVAHATRALAELYGSQLSRANGYHSNKGGIRLSFSKNPLGVRGPNSRRSGNTANGGNTGATTSYSYAAAFTNNNSTTKP